MDHMLTVCREIVVTTANLAGKESHYPPFSHKQDNLNLVFVVNHLLISKLRYCSKYL
jgi:hypothetical protein